MKTTDQTRDPKIETDDKRSGDIEKLRQTIEDMDRMAQAAFDHISLLTTLVLRSMELPRTYKYGCVETFAEPFGIIQNLAETAMNDINATAEGVGCHFVDKMAREHSYARMDAARMAFSSADAAEAQP